MTGELIMGQGWPAYISILWTFLGSSSLSNKPGLAVLCCVSQVGPGITSAQPGLHHLWSGLSCLALILVLLWLIVIVLVTCLQVPGKPFCHLDPNRGFLLFLGAFFIVKQLHSSHVGLILLQLLQPKMKYKTYICILFCICFFLMCFFFSDKHRIFMVIYLLLFLLTDNSTSYVCGCHVNTSLRATVLKGHLYHFCSQLHAYLHELKQASHQLQDDSSHGASESFVSKIPALDSLTGPVSLRDSKPVQKASLVNIKSFLITNIFHIIKFTLPSDSPHFSTPVQYLRSEADQSKQRKVSSGLLISKLLAVENKRGGLVSGVRAGIRGGSGGQGLFRRALQGQNGPAKRQGGFGGCAVGGLRREADTGAGKSGRCCREWESAGNEGCRNSMGEGAELWVGERGEFLYLSIYPSTHQPRKAEKNWESSFRITKRQNIHSLFPGFRGYSPIQKFSAVKPKKRVLDTHWRRTLSYLLSHEYYPSIKCCKIGGLIKFKKLIINVYTYFGPNSLMCATNTRPKTKAKCTHCLIRYKGSPLYLSSQCVHIAFTLGLVLGPKCF
ncbi:hypothetical protein VP01_2378g2 [Puccinia sorghi]|uniref:Uncharacterized protein n=1 Tax=Puccinia sorghi TaxID=27349 RepID=A0A0L6V6X3_9BASI|nr:hypothetical protein VP01_2378g2 [Puccinia sorghi]